MFSLKWLRSLVYGVSAGVVFLALMYAWDIADVRSIFGPVPNPGGLVILLGGLTLLFIGVGMLLARITGGSQDI